MAAIAFVDGGSRCNVGFVGGPFYQGLVRVLLMRRTRLKEGGVMFLLRTVDVTFGFLSQIRKRVLPMVVRRS